MINKLLRPFVFIYVLLVCSLVFNYKQHLDIKNYKEIETAYLEMTDILGIDFSGETARKQEGQKKEFFCLIKIVQKIENGELIISLDVQ